MRIPSLPGLGDSPTWGGIKGPDDPRWDRPDVEPEDICRVLIKGGLERDPYGRDQDTILYAIVRDPCSALDSKSGDIELEMLQYILSHPKAMPMTYSWVMRAIQKYIDTTLPPSEFYERMPWMKRSLIS